MATDEFIQHLWEMGPTFTEATPHSKKLGIKFVAVDKGRATMSLPYNPDLIGDPDTRVLHGGAVTTLLDQACGLAAIAGFPKPTACATLNLSIDYMRAATPGETIIAQAHCYKATKHVAFLRAVAHDGDENDPIATAQATFMATSSRTMNPKMADKKDSASS